MWKGRRVEVWVITMTDRPVDMPGCRISARGSMAEIDLLLKNGCHYSVSGNELISTYPSIFGGMM